MFWRWLKNYMPRGLYGRAALILILPVLTVQVLVTVEFIQRYFDGVSRAMTSAVSIEVRFIRDTVNSAGNLDGAQLALMRVASPLEIAAKLPASNVPVADRTLWTDLTGSVVTQTLRDRIPEALVVALDDRSLVQLWMTTNYGPMQLSFDRSRVSASNPHQLLVIMIVMGTIITTISYFFLRNQLQSNLGLYAANPGALVTTLMLWTKP